MQGRSQVFTKLRARWDQRNKFQGHYYDFANAPDAPPPLGPVPMDIFFIPFENRNSII